MGMRQEEVFHFRAIFGMTTTTERRRVNKNSVTLVQQEARCIST